MSFVCLNTRLKKLVSRERELGSIQSNNLISSGIKLLKGKKKNNQKQNTTNKQTKPTKQKPHKTQTKTKPKSQYCLCTRRQNQCFSFAYLLSYSQERETKSTFQIVYDYVNKYQKEKGRLSLLLIFYVDDAFYQSCCKKFLMIQVWLSGIQLWLYMAL